MTETRHRAAAFVERQRLFKRQVAFLELFDDRLELGNRGFEVLNRSIGHRQALPRRTLTRTENTVPFYVLMSSVYLRSCPRRPWWCFWRAPRTRARPCRA